MLTFNNVDEDDGSSTYDILVMGAPFDLASTSNAGQRQAPYRIREAGFWENGYIAEHDIDWVEDLSWADMGDIELPQSDLLGGLDAISKAARKGLKRTKTLVTLGGDHSVSLATMRAYNKTTKLKPLVITFDAHHDFSTHEGDLLDHGTWVRDVLDEKLTDTVLQYGTRGWGYSREEHSEAADLGVNVMPGLPDKETLAYATRSGRPIHLSIDLDVCDPAFAPGVAYQEPGGWTAAQLLEAVFLVASTCHVRGLDITEVIPALDPSGITSRLANRVVTTFATGLACHLRPERAVLATQET